jgi:hypothetical protein
MAGKPRAAILAHNEKSCSDEDKPSSHTRVRHENAAAPSQSPLSAAIQSKLIDSLLTRVLWIAAFGSSKVGRIGMTSYTSTDVNFRSRLSTSKTTV